MSMYKCVNLADQNRNVEHHCSGPTIGLTTGEGFKIRTLHSYMLPKPSIVERTKTCGKAAE